MLKFFKNLLSIITLTFLLKKLDIIKNIYCNRFSTQIYFGFLCYHFVNMFAILFVFGLIYLSLKYLDLDPKHIITMIIIFSTSFIVYYFIFNNIKYSKNTIIRFIQNTVISFIFFYFITVICIFLVVIGTIYCEHTETYKLTMDLYGNIYTAVLTLSYDILKNVASSLSSASAGGAAASAMIRATVGLPLMQRLALIGCIAGVASGVVSLVIHISKALISNKDILNTLDLAVRISEHSNPDVNIIPSPVDVFINSPLENDSIPLINILGDLITLNVLEIFLFLRLLLLLIITNTYNNKAVNRMILYIINKFVPNKYQDKINKTIIIGKEYNNIANNLIIYVLISIIILFVLGNLFTFC